MGTPARNPEAAATKPKYFVIDDILHYQAKSGEELKFDLDFPGSVLEKIIEGDDTERNQFLTMLDGLGDKATAARVRKMGALEQTRLVNRFFAEFQKAVGADLGESDGSSDS